MKRILITDKVHDLLPAGLVDSGFQCDYMPFMPYEEVIKNVSNYSGIVINSKVICDEAFIDKASHLDFIGRLGSGLDIIDLRYAKEKNIKVISSPEGNANAVGEHALGMLLNLLNKISSGHNSIRNFTWERETNRGSELSGKIVGVVGFGHTGPAFAEKLKGFNTRVLIYDKYRTDLDPFKYEVVYQLDDLLNMSDIVSLHLPLTHETRGMVDFNFFRRMKEGSIIINTSRGSILKTSDLLDALVTGRLAGACLDVLENEKPESWDLNERKLYSNLFERNDVIMTPHIAGWTHRSLHLIAEIVLQKIRNFYQL